MSQKQYAISHPMKRGFHYKEDDEVKAVDNGSGIYDESGHDLNLPNPENHQTEEVKLSPDDQRYVNKRLAEKKDYSDAVDKEIANIKKKRGSKK